MNDNEEFLKFLSETLIRNLDNKLTQELATGIYSAIEQYIKKSEDAETDLNRNK